MAGQRLFIEHHGERRRRAAAKHRAGDPSPLEPPGKVLSHQFKLRAVEIGREHDINDTVTPPVSPGPGRLGPLWQRVDRWHGPCDISQRAVDVPPRLEGELKRRPALPRHAAHARDAVDVEKRRRHLANDGFVDLLGGGIRPAHRDINRIGDHIRERLGAHVERGKEPGDDEHHQEQVCRRPVTGKEA